MFSHVDKLCSALSSSISISSEQELVWFHYWWVVSQLSLMSVTESHSHIQSTSIRIAHFFWRPLSDQWKQLATLINATIFFFFIIISRNLRELLNEAHNATLLNPRAAAAFQGLAQRGQKLGKELSAKKEIKLEFLQWPARLHMLRSDCRELRWEHSIKYLTFSVICIWDSADINIPKVSNHRTQKRSSTTKHKRNALRRYYHYHFFYNLQTDLKTHPSR